MTLKSLSIWITAFAFFLHVSVVFAIDLDRSFSGQGQSQAEYFNSNRDKRILIQVNILSGVFKPGIHQIPDNTNLLDALALAGGLTDEADYEKVFIKRKNREDKTKFETIHYNLTDIVRDNAEPYPMLKNYDTVLIEPRSKTDQKLLTALTIFASAIGIITGGILISNAIKKK